MVVGECRVLGGVVAWREDAWLRKRVDVVDVWNTPAKDRNNKGEMPKRTEEKRKIAGRPA